MNLVLESFFNDAGRPGQIRVLTHLNSEKGKAMNGRRCVVVGVDPPSIAFHNRRLHVKLLDPNDSTKAVGKALKIKTKNVILPEHYCSAKKEPTLSKEVVIKFLKDAVRHGIAEGHDRLAEDGEAARDRYERMKLIQEYLRHDELPPTREMVCMDSQIPQNQQNEFELLKSIVTPACAGDGHVDFQCFGEGIIANGKDIMTECPICQEFIQDDLIRLPCNHRFHLNCVREWVQRHNNCPTCRKELKHPLDTYIFPIADDQVQTRFKEWFITGMCERCQAIQLKMTLL